MSTPTTPPESGGTDTVVIVGGQDWEEVVTAAAEAQPGERIEVEFDGIGHAAVEFTP